jgi:hypothetical protein
MLMRIAIAAIAATMFAFADGAWAKNAPLTSEVSSRLYVFAHNNLRMILT